MVQEICGAIDHGMVCTLYPNHTEAHAYSVRAYHFTRAVSDLWREIASVAGLACWADRILWPGSELPLDVSGCEPWECKRLRAVLGWEAPHGDD